MSEWKTVRLGDVCEQIRGVSYKPADLHNDLDDNSVTLLRANNILEDVLNYDDLVYVDNKKVSNFQYLKRGDILICASSGSRNLVGKAACLEEDRKLTFGAFCKVLRTDSINHGFFKHYFFSPNYRLTISNLSAGANINNIRAEDLDNLQIPLPPLETQKQIAAVLDKCTSLISKYKKILEKYDTLIKSRFIEMFGTEKDFSKWNCCKVEELADVTVGVVIKPTQYYCEKGIPAFRSLNIGEMKVNDSDWVYFNEEGMKKNIKSILKENDVLVVRSGAPGKSCVITKKYEGYNVVDAIIAHPNLEKINPVFLCMFTNMPHGMNQIKAKTGGAAQQHFNVGGYNDLNIILPPLDLQNDFATFVQQIDKSKFAVQKSLEKAETLYKSLMQEYFG